MRRRRMLVVAAAILGAIVSSNCTMAHADPIRTANSMVTPDSFDGEAPPNQNSLSADSHDWYCTWRHRPDCGQAFFTGPAIIGNYQRHMKAVLQHVNPLTGFAYRDDQTFAGWVDGNNLDLLDDTPTPVAEGTTDADNGRQDTDPHAAHVVNRN